MQVTARKRCGAAVCCSPNTARGCILLQNTVVYCNLLQQVGLYQLQNIPFHRLAVIICPIGATRFRDRPSQRNLPSDKKLVRILRKIASPEIDLIPLAEVWLILSECRHSIVHTMSNLEKPKMYKSKIHEKIFDDLYNGAPLTH